ncbi:MAG: TolB family protein [Candidatus Geothermincolia bacterium]
MRTSRHRLAPALLLLVLAPMLSACRVSPRAPGAGGARTLEGPSEAVVFIRGTDVWMIRADGSGEVRLTATGNRKAYPKLSPDGASVIFTFYPGVEDTAQAQIRRLPLAGLTEPAEEFELIADGFAACYDPYGDIYFARTLQGLDGRRRDEVYALRNGSSRSLTDFSRVQDAEGGLAIKFLAASPDGGTLGFVRGRRGDSRWITLMNRDGSDVRYLEEPWAQPDADGRGLADGAFSFFDARLLLLSHGVPNVTGSQSDHRVYRVDPVTGAERQLTPGPADIDPCLSPDGGMVVFERAGSLIVADSYGANESALAEGRQPFWGKAVPVQTANGG